MSEYPQPDEPVASVDASTLRDAIAAGEPVHLLDVRNRSEIEQWRIEGEGVERTEVPYTKFVEAEIGDRVGDLASDVEGPVTVVCGRGEASAYVASLLEGEGVEARNLDGGMDAWGRIYDATEVSRDGDVTVVQYERPSSGCLGYLLVAGDEAAVVDPLQAFSDRYADDAADYGADLRYAIDTHVHADHVSGVRRVAEETAAEPMLSERAVARGVEFPVTELADGERLPLGDAELEVVPLPGHTTGMTGIAVEDVLLTGDSLFVESVARPDLEAGDDGAPEAARELHRTVTERLASFDDSTVVAPGHAGEASERAADGSVTAKLGSLRERLPAFRQDESAFVEAICADMPPRPANFERIIDINLGRESAADEEAFELEQGPNNCAATAADAD
ncbi:MBL fold metallo-hydrolase [Haloarculaceae archaeon H-GB2-1]|nr:MBL fold metallo-hydrolase [Haloarculaceae archaeon H-GB1-1]MEA5406279.1 MBL fold metallo-hydrolase [Haloarculaceae archaeon H-GB2-1]